MGFLACCGFVVEIVESRLEVYVGPRFTGWDLSMLH